jgi:subtilisin family serine protease
MRLCVPLSLVALLVLAACSDDRTSPSDGSADPSFGSTSATVRLNVILKSPATATTRLELSKYGTIFDEIARLNAVLLKAKSSQIAAIAKLPFVQSVGQDATRDIGPIDLIPADVTDFAGSNNVWNLDAINVTDKLSGGRKVAQDGSDVYVAILDTGLLPSWRAYFPDARIATQYAKAFGGGGQDNGNVSEQPGKWEQDVDAHGTHVTSVVLGYQYSSLATGATFRVDGVAPRATVIPVKVLGQNGSGWSSRVAQGITYVADLVDQNGLLDGKRVVINMSLGGGELDPLEQKAIDYATGRNVVIVAAAGNDGPDGAMHYPGAYAPVISVAAAGWTGEWNDPASNCSALGNGTDALTAGRWWRQCDVEDPYNQANFYIADFSAKRTGTQDLDVAAPGSWVVGPYQVNQGKPNYFFLGGTSQATPHVTGIVALLLQKQPTIASTAVEGVLEAAAKPLTFGSQAVRPAPGAPPLPVPSWTTDRSGAGLLTADAVVGAIP